MNENCKTKIVLETDDYILVSEKEKIYYAYYCPYSKKILFTGHDENIELSLYDTIFLDKLCENGFIRISDCYCINPLFISEYKFNRKEVTMINGTTFHLTNRFKNILDKYFEINENI